MTKRSRRHHCLAAFVAALALAGCGPSGECIDVAAASKRLSYGMTTAEVKQVIPAKPDFTGKSPVEEYRAHSY